MPPNDDTELSKTTFSARYSSPTNVPFTITEDLAATAAAASAPQRGEGEGDLASKTAYLASLRRAARAAQEQINQELTARMEEDKAAAAADGAAPGTAVKTADEEEKEEENYGEEVIEEDD